MLIDHQSVMEHQCVIIIAHQSVIERQCVKF